MNKTAILGILALFAVLAVSTAAAAEPQLYLVPQDSTVSGYCNTTNVEIRLSIPEGMSGGNVHYGQFGISYDPLCGNITSRTLNTGFGPGGSDPSWASWNAPALENNCWNDTMDWIVFSFWYPHAPPQDVLIGSFTIHCNSTEYCTNDLNFGYMPGCIQGRIYMWNTNDEKIPYDSPINGTFTCLASEETYETTLEPGWNLISMPLDPESHSTAVVLSSLAYDAVWRLNATSHEFESELGGTMDLGIGYLVNVTASGQTWTYSGTAYTSMNLNLKEKLNMIGWLNCSRDIVGSEDALGTISGNYWDVVRLNATTKEFEPYVPVAPEDGGFNKFTKMERGTGYYISMKQADELSKSC